MLNSVKKLSGCRIVATDGEVGAGPYAAYWAWDAIPLAVPPDPQIRDAAEERRRAADRADADTHLRSSEAVLGYHARASDGLSVTSRTFSSKRRRGPFAISLSRRTTGCRASVFSSRRSGFVA
jgi:hypothetical protein